MNGKKRVCVIGAGISGLIAVKECLDEGLIPTCYEQDSDIGGIWNPSAEAKDTKTPMVWDTLVTNTPKYQCCASDFPPPDEWSPYISWKTYKQYWQNYIDHFKLNAHINLNTTVSSVRRTQDHETTGRWEVVSKQSGSLEKIEVYDAVMVCIGAFRRPRYPKIEGLDKFPGELSHSYYYKNGDPYHKKKVIVVGNSLSAIDVSTDIAKNQPETILAVGSGSWVLPQVSSEGIPCLEKFHKRKFVHGKLSDLSKAFMEEANRFLDHEGTNLRADMPPPIAPVAISNQFQLEVLSGNIKILPYLVKVEGQRAHFSDGTVEDNVDAIVCATGFDTDLGLVKEENLMDEDGKRDLYQWMWPLGRDHNTLTFIGQVQFFTANAPIMEIQCRYATKVFKGDKKLPSQQVMKGWMDAVNAKFAQNNYRYKEGVLYCEEIAAEIGVYPSFWSIVMRDPWLAWRVWYGAIFSSHYRLIGDGANFEEARKISHKAYEAQGKTSGGRKLGALMGINTCWSRWSKGFISLFLVPMCLLFACSLFFGTN